MAKQILLSPPRTSEDEASYPTGNTPAVGDLPNEMTKAIFLGTIEPFSISGNLVYSNNTSGVARTNEYLVLISATPEDLHWVTINDFNIVAARLDDTDSRRETWEALFPGEPMPEPEEDASSKYFGLWDDDLPEGIPIEDILEEISR